VAPADTALSLRCLTVPEVARYLRMSRDRVRDLIRRGELRAIDTAPTRCGRPRWIITPEALAEWERRRTAGPQPKPVRRRKRTPDVDYYPD
jgi:excisionase family DNA binding protein